MRAKDHGIYPHHFFRCGAIYPHNDQQVEQLHDIRARRRECMEHRARQIHHLPKEERDEDLQQHLRLEVPAQDRKLTCSGDCMEKISTFSIFPIRNDNGSSGAAQQNTSRFLVMTGISSKDTMVIKDQMTTEVIINGSPFFCSMTMLSLNSSRFMFPSKHRKLALTDDPHHINETPFGRHS